MSSRRRIYPNAYLNYDDDDYFGDNNNNIVNGVDKGQKEEEQNIQNFQMSKKDLESLVYQVRACLRYNL